MRIRFIYYRNIHRNPMAEFFMKDPVKTAESETQSYIESAAASTEENGCTVYPPARRKLAEYGNDCTGKTARQLTNPDCNKYDLLIGMDRANLRFTPKNISAGSTKLKMMA